MADQIVITEKTSQAKDVRAAVGSRLPIPTKSPLVSEMMAPPDSGMMSPPVGRVLLAFLV